MTEASSPEGAASRPDWGLRGAALGALITLIMLGVWQLQRQEWKTALLADLEARQAQEPVDITWLGADAMPGQPGEWVWLRENQDQVRFAPVVVRGRYDHARQVGAPATLEGVAGWRIVTPLIFDSPDETVLFIDRGFTPSTPETASVPPAFVSSDESAGRSSDGGVEAPLITVRGIIRPAAAVSRLLPNPDPEARVSYTLAPAVLAQAAFSQDEAYDYQVAPFTVSAVSEEPAGPGAGSLTPHLPTVESISNRHLEYALTWFGLAGALIAVFVAHQWRRRAATRA